MTYYSLEQTLKIFQEKLPETLLPFDLPQLADLCRRENVTPVFPYAKYVSEGFLDEHEQIVSSKKDTRSFTGYLTLPDLAYLIFQQTEILIVRNAYIYEEIGTNDKGELVTLEKSEYERSDYCGEFVNYYDTFSSGHAYHIHINHLLFPIAQVQAYIASKHLNELDNRTPIATMEMFSNPTVVHDKPQTYNQLIEALIAANDKIKQQEQDINRLNSQLNEQTDKHLYNWQAMNKYSYPPELHLALMIWKQYYEHESAKHTTQFNSSKFNRIAAAFKLEDGNLKERVRTVLTPLEAKVKSPQLISSLKQIQHLHNDKLNQN